MTPHPRQLPSCPRSVRAPGSSEPGVDRGDVVERHRRSPAWGAALAGLLLVTGCRKPAPRPPPPPVDVGVEVRAAQLQLVGAFHADQKRAALACLRAGLPQLGRKILAVLGDRGHPDFVAAAELAAELGFEDATEALLDAASDAAAPNRAAAMAAANRIQPVPTERLAALLGHADVDLQRVLLAAMVDRSDVPFDAVAPLLAASDATVAKAAATVLPTDLTPEQSTNVARTMFANVDAARIAIEQLAQRPLPELFFVSLLDLLPRESAPVQEAILAAVAGRKNVPLQQPLRELVRDSPAPSVRFAALYCLLAANAADADWLLARSYDLPRPHRVLCAVGLLRARRVEGARLLHDLAFTAVDDDKVDAVALAARQIMSRAADLPLHRGAAAFAAWCELPIVARPEALALPERELRVLAGLPD